MNVKFLRGTLAQYQAITPNADTLYFITDEGKIYLGSILVADKIGSTDIANAIAALDATVNSGDADLVKVSITEVDGKLTSVTVDDSALDSKLVELIEALDASINSGDADLVKVSITEVDGVLTEVAIDDSKLDQKLADDLQAAKDYTDAEITKIVTGSGYATTKYVDDAVAGHVAEQAVIDAAQDKALADYKAEQAILDAAQDKALNDYKAEMVETLKGYQTTIPAETYDAYGSAAAAETAAKEYADEQIDNLIKTYIDGDVDSVINTLEEVAAWINNDTAGVTKIIEDVATNAAGVKQNKEDLDKVEAKLNGIAEGDGTVKNYIDNVDAKFADYTKTSDLGDLATKDESELNLGQYAKTADISEDIAKGVAAKAVTDTIGDYVKKSDAPGYGDIWTEAEHNTYASEVSTAIENAEKAAKDHADAEIGKLGTMAKEAASDYTKTADLGALATKDSINKITTDDLYGAEIAVGYEEEYRTGYVEITDKANSSQKVILDVQGNISVIEGASPDNPTGVVKSGMIAVVSDVSAAEGRAAADATSKANTAESNAKAHADAELAKLSKTVTDNASACNTNFEAIATHQGTQDDRLAAIEAALTWGTIGE